MSTAPPRHARAGRRRLVRALVVVGVLVALVGAGVVAADVAFRTRYDANIERFEDPFEALPEEERPAPVEGEDGGVAQNFLLLGSDSRISAGDASQWEFGAQRTDAIMLVHLPADRSALYVVSIPRDTWVDVPGHGQAKINAAFSFGGPPLLVQTVEQLTGLRVDHLGVVDFEGFVAMTDALGGVEITVPEDTADMRAEFEAGTYRMGGEEALSYVRQRYGLAGGDFDRVKRQQNWIRAVLSEAASRDTLTNPGRLDDFLRATTRSISLDAGMGAGDLRSLALELRNLRSDDMHFLTVPTDGTGRSADGQSIVVLDEAGADELWRAATEEQMAEYVASHADDLLGDEVS